MKRLYFLWIIGLLFLFTVLPADGEEAFIFFNPSPAANTAYTSVSANDIRANTDLKDLVGVDSLNGEKLPLQVEKGRVVLAVPLEPFSGRAVRFKRGAKAPDKGVTVSEEDGRVVVENPYYQVVLEKDKGYAVTGIKDKSTGKLLTGEFCSLTLYKKRGPAGPKLPAPGYIHQTKEKPALKVLSSGPLVAEIEISWENDSARVKERLTFYHQRSYFRQSYEINLKKAMENIQVNTTTLDMSYEHVVFYPGEKKLYGYTPWYFLTSKYPYLLAFDKSVSSGFGVIGLPGDGVQRIGGSNVYSSWDTFLRAYTFPLYDEPLNKKIVLTIYPFLCNQPDKAENILKQVKYPALFAGNGETLLTKIESSSIPTLVGRDGKFDITMANLSPGSKQIPIRMSSPGRVEKKKLNVPGGTRQTIDFSFPNQSSKESYVVSWNDLKLSLPALTPQPVVEIEEVRPQKLLYEKNEDALFTVRLRSNSSQKEEVNLNVYLLAGIEEKISIISKNVILDPLEKKEETIKWNTGEKEYGFEIVAEVIDGDIPVSRGREYFLVSDEFYKVSQMMVANAGWCNQATQPEKWLLDRCRDSYTGIIEYYCWAPSHFGGLVPQTEIFMPRTESQTSYLVELSRSWLKDFIKQGHDQGMKIVMEISGCLADVSIAAKYPQWMRYTEDGQWGIFNYKIHSKDLEIGTVTTYSNDPRAMELYAGDAAESVRMFDWDGVRFDGSGFGVASIPADPLRFGQEEQVRQYDFRGNVIPAPNRQTDLKGKANAEKWISAVKKVKPKFGMGSNSGPAYIRKDEEVKVEAKRNYKFGVVDQPETMRATFYRAMAGCEGAIDVAGRWDTWDLWTRYLYVNRRVFEEFESFLYSMVQSGGMPPIADRLTRYISFASRYHLWDYEGRRYYPDGGDEICLANRFATRFAEFYYADNILSLDPLHQKEISIVSSDDRVYWKYFVYERVFPKKRQLIVHLINLPEEDRIFLHHSPPPLRKNIKAYFEIPRGFKFTGAWAISPEPKPGSRKLTSSLTAGKVKVEVPPLISTHILMAEFEKE